jgi:hypothetical protein
VADVPSGLSLTPPKETKKITLRPAIYSQSVCLEDKSLETHEQFFLTEHCGHSSYVTFSDEVMDLPFTIAAGPRQRILRYEYYGTHDHILLSLIRNSPNLGGQVPLFIFPRNRVIQLYPSHWVPFSSLPTARRATMDVFDTASTLTGLSKLKSKLLYDLRFTANQFVFAPSPLRPAIRDFFQLNACCSSPCLISSLARKWICLL